MNNSQARGSGLRTCKSVLYGCVWVCLLLSCCGGCHFWQKPLAVLETEGWRITVRSVARVKADDYEQLLGPMQREYRLLVYAPDHRHGYDAIAVEMELACTGDGAQPFMLEGAIYGRDEAPSKPSLVDANGARYELAGMAVKSRGWTYPDTILQGFPFGYEVWTIADYGNRPVGHAKADVQYRSEDPTRWLVFRAGPEAKGPFQLESLGTSPPRTIGMASPDGRH